MAPELPPRFVDQMTQRPMLGPINLMPSALIVEQLCSARFDFIWLDMEHGPHTMEDIASAVPLCLGRGVTPIVRVPGIHDWALKWVLDQGVRGVIFPFINSAEDARAAVSGCKYPPAGHRGYFPNVAAMRWDASVDDYFARANDEIAVILQIETGAAVEQLEQIAAVDGWDALFVGPSDLSISYGKRGQVDDPEVAGGIDRAREVAHRAGKHAGILAVSAEDVKRRIDEGFDFIAVKPDVMIVEEAIAGYAEQLAQWLQR